jgi:hypothetical protein
MTRATLDPEGLDGLPSFEILYLHFLGILSPDSLIPLGYNTPFSGHYFSNAHQWNARKKERPPM